MNLREEPGKGKGLGEKLPALGPDLVEFGRGENDPGDNKHIQGRVKQLELMGKIKSGSLRHGVVGDEKIDVR
ncbi:MAG TPA: hypothetical protein VK593_04215 [Edaphobacter sp.]|nr:hypothetical protein [Edaphobacter sp.]